MNSSSLSGVFWSTLTIKSNSNLVELHIFSKLSWKTLLSKKDLLICWGSAMTEEGLQRPSWLQVPIKPRLAVLQHAPITTSYCFPPLCMCNVHLCDHQHIPITLSFYFPPLNSSCPYPSMCTWPCSPTCTCNADPTIITYHLIIAWSDFHFVIRSIISNNQHAQT